MALWVYVFIGTTPLGSVITGWIITVAGPRTALLVGAGHAGRLPCSPFTDHRWPCRGRMPPMAVHERAVDDGQEVTTKVSPRSVPDTVAGLSAVIAERGLTLFAVIDHSGEAKKVGLELRDTKLVIFGSPMAGTPAMVSTPLVALDLPLRVVVWADGSTTKISYTAPMSLAARYGLTADLAAPLAGIDAITDEVIGD